MTTTEAVVHEVERLHDLLAGWIGAGAPVLEEFLAAQTDDFSLVTVDGQVLDLPTLRAALAGAGGADPGLRIVISEVETVAELGDAVLIRFLETHRGGGSASARRVSAVLQGPELRWRHVHETPVAVG